MNLLQFIIICSISLNEFSSSVTTEDSHKASLNDLIDEITENIGLTGNEIGLEPLKIPDIHQEKRTDGGVQVFNLTEGELKNVISIKRFGEAEATYSSNTLNIKTGVQFIDLESNFNFNLKTWGLNPDGHVTVITPVLSVTIDVSVDSANLNATLNDVLISSVGDLNVSIKTTKPIYGMVMDALIESFTLFFQDEIVYIIGKVITAKANEFIQEISSYSPK